MDSVFNYSVHAFPFHNVVKRIFACDNLLFLHEKIGDTIPNFDFQPGKDQHSVFHQRFYDIIQEDPTFLNMYRRFIQDIILPIVRCDSIDKILYQKIPTFRVHLPNNKAVGGRAHKDADYNHPLGEINFLVPLTPMKGTSSVFYETSPDMGDFRFKDLDPGDCWMFDGNQCQHGNMPNSTGWTRVSFDFRLISETDLQKHKHHARSVAHGLKFAAGEYYETL